MSPLRRLPLRTRVALAAATAVFLAVAALGGASQLIVSHELRAALDRALVVRARDVSRLSVSAPALLTAPAALDAPSGGRDLVVEVLDRRGGIVARSAALGGRLLEVDRLVGAAIARGRTGVGRVRLTGADVRAFVAPLPAGGPAGGGAVIVGSSTTEIDRTLAHLRGLLLGSALAAAVLGALAAAALTARGMRPLRRLSAGAGAISQTGDPSRRLPLAGSGEVADLTRTLNGMLDAIERAQATERRFLADASHELRTPVTALVGNVAYLARHGADAGVLADLSADAARLARLIDDLLTLERREGAPAQTERVDLGVLARAVAGDALAEAEHVEVLGDERALTRALENLLGNARLHGAPPVRVVVGRRDGRAAVAVSDAGPGIAAEHADAALGRFWRGPGAAHLPGSGLGLAIVRGIARAHGGEVRVEGATFTLLLPLAPPIVTNPSGARSSVHPMPDTRPQS